MFAERLLIILRSWHHKNREKTVHFIMEGNWIDIVYLKRKFTGLLFIINLLYYCLTFAYTLKITKYYLTEVITTY